MTEEAANKKVKIKKVVCIITLILGIVLAVASVPLYYIDNPDVTYETYKLESQYIGDIEGYQDCLIMEVQPVILNKSTFQWINSGQKHLLYFAEEDKLLNTPAGSIISAQWEENRITGQKHIAKIDTVFTLPC